MYPVRRLRPTKYNREEWCLGPVNFLGSYTVGILSFPGFRRVPNKIVYMDKIKLKSQMQVSAPRSTYRQSAMKFAFIRRNISPNLNPHELKGTLRAERPIM
jgi:hypothetical protein